MDSPTLEECMLQKKTELSVGWVQDRLDIGCNCTTLMVHNLARIKVICDEFPFIHTVGVQIFYICLFSALILLSLAGNLTVIWIILRHERMRTVTNMYLLNLALSDVAITILNTGFSGTYNLYYNWVFSSAHCAINNLMGITPICASVFTMEVMSIDRYLAIVYPLRRRPGRGATVTIIIGIWFVAFICGMPALAATKIERYFFVSPTDNTVFEDRLCLADQFPDGDSETSELFSLYNHSLVVLQYVIPLLILSVTYGRVVYVLRRNHSIGDTRHNENVRAKRKAANMLALVVFTFVFMWLPYNLYFLFLSSYLREVLDNKKILYLYINIYCLGMSSCISAWLPIRFSVVAVGKGQPRGLRDGLFEYDHQAILLDVTILRY